MPERRRRRREGVSKRYATIDAAWLDFYAEDTLAARNSLLLHYAPYVKAVVSRYLPAAPEDLHLMAIGMLALGRAIDNRPAGALGDFHEEVVSAVSTACRVAIRAAQVRKVPGE